MLGVAAATLARIDQSALRARAAASAGRPLDALAAVRVRRVPEKHLDIRRGGSGPRVYRSIMEAELYAHAERLGVRRQTVCRWSDSPRSGPVCSARYDRNAPACGTGEGHARC